MEEKLVILLISMVGGFIGQFISSLIIITAFTKLNEDEKNEEEKDYELIK